MASPKDPSQSGLAKVAAVGASANFLTSDSDFAEFHGVRLEDRILNVRIHYAAMRDLRELLAARSGDVLGLLLGSYSSQTLCIEGYEPVLFMRENPDYACLRDAVGQFTGDAPRLIGFFRSQPAGRPEITRADCEVMRRHLPNLSENGGFFMVIEAPRFNPWSAMLFALDATGMPTSDNSMLEFTFNANLLRQKFSSDFVPEFESPRPKEIPGSTSPTLDVAKLLSGVRADLHNSRLWLVGALCVVVLLGIGILCDRLYQFSGRTHSEARGVAPYQLLGLKVTRSGTDFEISWDRASNAVRLASDGTMTIRDGQFTKSVNLDPTQLREGKILYSPLFSELTVRFELSDNQRRIAGESVQVLGPGINPSSGILSADLSFPLGSASRSFESLPQPSAVGSVAARGGKDSAGPGGGKPTEPRVTQPPNAIDRQRQLPQASASARVPEMKAVSAETSQTVLAKPAIPAPTPAVLSPAEAPARPAEAAMLAAEAPAARVPLPSVAPPVIAVAAPTSAISQPVASQPVALRPVASQPVAPQPVASQPVAPQPVASQPVASQPIASRPVASQPVAPQPVASQPIASQPINVTSNLQAAKLIKKVIPVYPSLAKESRIQGTVRFNANIGGDGRIRKVQYAAGPSVLVSAAAEAVKQWIYEPTLLNGQPIDVNTTIDVVFALNPK